MFCLHGFGSAAVLTKGHRLLLRKWLHYGVSVSVSYCHCCCERCVTVLLGQSTWRQIPFHPSTQDLRSLELLLEVAHLTQSVSVLLMFSEPVPPVACLRTSCLRTRQLLFQLMELAVSGWDSVHVKVISGQTSGVLSGILRRRLNGLWSEQAAGYRWWGR